MEESILGEVTYSTQILPVWIISSKIIPLMTKLLHHQRIMGYTIIVRNAAEVHHCKFHVVLAAFESTERLQKARDLQLL